MWRYSKIYLIGMICLWVFGGMMFYESFNRYQITGVFDDYVYSLFLTGFWAWVIVAVIIVIDIWWGKRMAKCAVTGNDIVTKDPWGR